MKSFKSKQGLFFCILLLIELIFSVSTYFAGNKTIAYVELGITVVSAIVYIVIFRKWNTRTLDILTELSNYLSFENRETINALSMPVVIADSNGTLLWFNNTFREDIYNKTSESSYDITDYLAGRSLSDLITTKDKTIKIDEKYYGISPVPINSKKEKAYAIFYFDITDLKVDADKYKSIKPAVLLGFYDNYDEMFQDYSEGECIEIKNGIDRILDNWLSEYSCILRRLGSERFIVIAHEKDLKSMMERKFDILSKVKEYKFNGRPSGVTFSIGVGRGESLIESERIARQALDMALSRGGDQVAVRTNDSYEFFGGLAVGNEKTHKVRSRVVASAISQLISSCDDVFIMGHMFSDMDSIGAAIGLYTAAKKFGKKAYVVCDKSKTLAHEMIKRFVSESGDNPFITPQGALTIFDKKSVLFIVDTHRRDSVESSELLDLANNVVIIDHHRKSVDFINNSVVFHHDPNASSASEMVTELLPYLTGDMRLNKYEAEALLAGIMLDTKNFILRTGVRTFEAAAYLRDFGADSVLVRELFSCTAEEYKIRNRIVSSAFIYKECAIAFTEVDEGDIRIIASQSADELLNISGVKASFVLYKTEDGVNISARSLGATNVQLIMEALGGGGHLTMSGAQLKNISAQEALSKIKIEIDKYFDNL